MNKPPRLHLVREPQAAERKILQFPVRPHTAAADPRPPERPSPGQDAWRDRVHHLTQNPVKTEDR